MAFTLWICRCRLPASLPSLALKTMKELLGSFWDGDFKWSRWLLNLNCTWKLKGLQGLQLVVSLHYYDLLLLLFLILVIILFRICGYGLCGLQTFPFQFFLISFFCCWFELLLLNSIAGLNVLFLNNTITVYSCSRTCICFCCCTMTLILILILFP